ncbi:MAG: hypothetical protein V4608_03485 [Bacteroidota bacterium]
MIDLSLAKNQIQVVMNFKDPVSTPFQIEINANILGPESTRPRKQLPGIKLLNV